MSEMKFSNRMDGHRQIGHALRVASDIKARVAVGHVGERSRGVLLFRLVVFATLPSTTAHPCFRATSALLCRDYSSIPVDCNHFLCVFAVGARIR